MARDHSPARWTCGVSVIARNRTTKQPSFGLCRRLLRPARNDSLAVLITEWTPAFVKSLETKSTRFLSVRFYPLPQITVAFPTRLFSCQRPNWQSSHNYLPSFSRFS